MIHAFISLTAIMKDLPGSKSSSHVNPPLRRFLRRQRTPELNHLHGNDMAPPWHPPFTLGSGRLKYLPFFSATLPMRHDITFLLTLPATHRTQ
jgi:hypothetical protein